MNDKTLHQRMTETINMWYEDEDYDEWWIYQRDYLEARNTIEAQATRIAALEAALRETMSRCTDCGGRGSFVKHDEVTDRDLWESCASCAVGYAALESQP